MVGKTGGVGHLRDAERAALKQHAGMVNTTPQEVLMRRKARSTLELARKRGRTDLRGPCKLSQPNRLTDICFEIIDRAPNRRWHRIHMLDVPHLNAGRWVPQ